MLSSLLFAAAIRLAVATPISLNPRASECACGYRDDQGNLWRESMISDFAGDYNRVMSQDFYTMSWGTSDNGYRKQNLKENLIPTSEGLQFKVKGYDGSGTIYVSEIESRRSDILYGTFRFDAKNTDVPGTCLGLFTYTEGGQETDIELLSHEKTGSIWYTNQPSTNTNPTVSMADGVANFATSFFEHRFDWLPAQTDFYVNSEKKATLNDQIQTVPTRLMLNHWSNGDERWSAGPPKSDAIATIKAVRAYFNSTSLNDATFQAQCTSAGVEECSI